MNFHTYVIECTNGSLYTGWTTDLDNRLKEHMAGKGAKYTRANPPLRMVASWTFPSKSEAMRWEWQFKRLSRTAKRALIAQLH